VIVSYHLSSSLWVWGSSKFCFRVLGRISWVLAVGMFVYMLVMSSEARAKSGSMGVSFSL
jgi:preprotein translocase subunit SecG